MRKGDLLRRQPHVPNNKICGGMSVQFAVISQDLQQGRHALVELGQVNHARQAFLGLWPRLLGWASLIRAFGFKHPTEKALYDFAATS